MEFSKYIKALDSGRSNAPPVAEEKPQTAPIEIVKMVQAELNRIGCSLGEVDGVVGPASRRALKTATEKLRLDYDEKLFLSLEFAETLKRIGQGFCPKPKPSQPSRLFYLATEYRMYCSSIHGRMSGKLYINRYDVSTGNFSGRMFSDGKFEPITGRIIGRSVYWLDNTGTRFRGSVTNYNAPGFANLTLSVTRKGVTVHCSFKPVGG